MRMHMYAYMHMFTQKQQNLSKSDFVENDYVQKFPKPHFFVKKGPCGKLLRHKMDLKYILDQSWTFLHHQYPLKRHPKLVKIVHTWWKIAKIIVWLFTTGIEISKSIILTRIKIAEIIITTESTGTKITKSSTFCIY